jgi:hypothetical protein
MAILDENSVPTAIIAIQSWTIVKMQKMKVQMIHPQAL